MKSHRPLNSNTRSAPRPSDSTSSPIKSRTGLTRARCSCTLPESREHFAQRRTLQARPFQCLTPIGLAAAEHPGARSRERPRRSRSGQYRLQRPYQPRAARTPAALTDWAGASRRGGTVYCVPFRRIRRLPVDQTATTLDSTMNWIRGLFVLRTLGGSVGGSDAFRALSGHWTGVDRDADAASGPSRPERTVR